MNAVRTEAFTALADYAREVIPTVIRRRLAVEVRDETSKPFFRAMMVLAIEVIASDDYEQPKHEQ